MRGFRTIVLIYSALICTMLLLSGCGKTKNPETMLGGSPSPQIEIEEVQENPSPTESSDLLNQTGQTTATPQASETSSPAISRDEVQANTALVDALIKELDDMGSLLDSLDDPQDSDFELPPS